MMARRPLALIAMTLLLLMAVAASPLAVAASGQAGVDPATNPLAAPRGLIASGGNCCVHLTWQVPESPPEPVIFYNVYRRQGEASQDAPLFLAGLDPDALGYVDFEVFNDQTYVYEVRAQYDDKVESLAADPATVSPEAAGLSVVLHLGQTVATVNGAEVTLDAPAQVVGGATMVPLRFVASSLGAEVKYDSGPRQITATLGPRVVRLWIGGRQAEVDGQPRPIASPPCLIQGRTMVPVRFISEAFGAVVDYVPAGGKVTVDMPDGDAALDQATPLTIGLPAVAALNGSNDVDYYRLQTKPGETYVARTHDLGSGCDTVLTWITATGVALCSDDASRDSKASELQIVKYGEDAFLYFRVQSAEPGGDNPAGNYSLTVDRRAVDPLQAIALLLIGGEPHEGELLSPSDMEYYSFSATAGRTYRVTTENLPPQSGSEGETNQADTAVWLLEGLGDYLMVVDADDDSSTVAGDPYAAELYYTAQTTGPCYVLVNSRTGEAGRYRVKVDFADAVARVSSQATDTPVDTRAWREWLDSAEAQNWFKFTAVQGTRYWLQTLELGPLCDTVLTLYDKDTRTELDGSDDSPGRGNGSLVEWVAPSNGVYYARVTPYGGGLGGFVFCVTTTGPEYDYFNWDYATPVTPDGEAVPGSAVDGDYDWFVFTAAKGLTYTIKTADLAPGCDTYLLVMDEDGNLLGENDDIDYEGGNLASRVEWTATATVKVYVRVTPRAEGDQDGTGVYELEVTTTAEGTGL